LCCGCNAHDTLACGRLILRGSLCSGEPHWGAAFPGAGLRVADPVRLTLLGGAALGCGVPRSWSVGR
ncbi:MAG: hypothetical protein J7M39_02255, partial [Anaerolineae bacterium]|nr:hypothetical protein [Anaerolineae bacterium]